MVRIFLPTEKTSLLIKRSFCIKRTRAKIMYDVWSDPTFPLHNYALERAENKTRIGQPFQIALYYKYWAVVQIFTPISTLSRALNIFRMNRHL